MHENKCMPICIIYACIYVLMKPITAFSTLELGTTREITKGRMCVEFHVIWFGDTSFNQFQYSCSNAMSTKLWPHTNAQIVLFFAQQRHSCNSEAATVTGVLSGFGH